MPLRRLFYPPYFPAANLEDFAGLFSQTGIAEKMLRCGSPEMKGCLYYTYFLYLSMNFGN